MNIENKIENTKKLLLKLGINSDLKKDLRKGDIFAEPNFCDNIIFTYEDATFLINYQNEKKENSFEGTNWLTLCCDEEAKPKLKKLAKLIQSELKSEPLVFYKTKKSLISEKNKSYCLEWNLDNPMRRIINFFRIDYLKLLEIEALRIIDADNSMLPRIIEPKHYNPQELMNQLIYLANNPKKINPKKKAKVLTEAAKADVPEL